MLAKLGVMQGASMFLGPFGYGITAFEFIHQSGGDMTRVAAIEQVSQEKTEPIHKELIAALADKDPAVRAAAAKALAGYHDQSTSNAIYPLFADKKYPVRLTAAAAYLRTTGTPGPLLPAIARGSRPGARAFSGIVIDLVLLSFRSEAEESAFARSTTMDTPLPKMH